MFVPSEFKKVIDVKNLDNIKQSYLNILSQVVMQYISDKNLFEFKNFFATYCDEYVLNTNCHNDIFLTLYLMIDQPLNYKPNIKTKKRKSNKITIPELYMPLDKILDELFGIIAKTFNSTNLIWKTSNMISIKSSIENDFSNVDAIYINIIPCLVYHNKDNKCGVIYPKNGEVEIEYPDILIENFNKKNKQTKDLYRQIIVMFKNILLKDEKITTLPSEIIETILYNVPNKLFVNDQKDTLINIINFIRNHNLQDFNTIDEQDKAFTSRYRSMSPYYVKHILKILEKFLANN
ncbi:MAG: hypothetical protein E7345_00165 [Clostridiales bacterium]|nr:hypothetical protein [Clostridiales bacterium]